jgi:hypothetical protein
MSVVWKRGERRVSCQAGDFNLHGLFLQTDESTVPGSLLQLRVTLPEGTIDMFVTARFVGRTVSGHGIGVEIFIISDEDRELWTRHYHHAQQALVARLGAERSDGSGPLSLR